MFVFKLAEVHDPKLRVLEESIGLFIVEEKPGMLLQSDLSQKQFSYTQPLGKNMNSLPELN